jgi:arginine-tRNA-protein transferase
MTEYGIYYPAAISGKQLDIFLAKGWYRMGQGIFTTNYVIQEDKFFRVYWLRYNLHTLKMGRQAQQVARSCKQFQVDVKPLVVTEELEQLYSLYRSSLSFEPAESVKSWLFDMQLTNIYDSHVVEVRDNNLLVAAGIFDAGYRSIAGILNCYHPAYRKNSLGKYLMLEKIRHATALGKQWYYPGYIVKDYPKFDYKLFVDKTAAEIFMPESNCWYLYSAALMADCPD